MTVHFGDILDPFSILNILSASSVDEIYHLGAQSHVGTSFNIQLYTCDVNALGTLRNFASNRCSRHGKSGEVS